MCILFIKNISLYKNSDLRYKPPRPAPLRRGAAHRHVTLGAGRDGRRLCQVATPTRHRLAVGEVVWSWRRDRGVYPACPCGLGKGDNKRRSPGRARISRQTSRGESRRGRFHSWSAARML